MHPLKRTLGLIILLGGSAVLASYIFGVLPRPDASDVLWSGVPQFVRPFYTIGMFLGALGYFFYTTFILFRLDAGRTTIAGRFGYTLFSPLYALILIPSALWLPLTFMAVDRSSLLLAWAVRLDLYLVAAASLGILFALLNLQPRTPTLAHRMAVLGSLFFCLQTVLLDALVWGSQFKI